MGGAVGPASVLVAWVAGDARSREAPLINPRFVSSGLVVAAFSALVGASGCSATTEDDGKSGDALSTAESDLKVSGAKYIGRIGAGETKTVSYDGPPAYRAFGFEAKGGDQITLTVASEDGDAMGWLTDSNYTVLASNDDMSSQSLDSRVTFTVPKGVTRRSFRAVFREYDQAKATFRVSLEITPGEPVTCSYQNQTYPQGASFQAADGCNTCSCGPSGVACTKVACLQCNPATETNRNYLGTPQSCMTIRFTCQPGWRPFQNTCGCGCERLN